MRHHIIPRFYLEGFTDPDVPEGHAPHLWLYSFDTRRWRKRGSRNVATVAGYYSWTDDTGQERHDAEQGLSIMENSVAHILREKIQTQRGLSTQERLHLGVFAMSMYMRVPSQHRLMHEMASRRGTEEVRRRLREWQEHPELFEEAKRRQEERTGRRGLGDFDPKALNPDSFTATPHRAASIAASLTVAIHAAPGLCSMGWRFLVARPPDYFVTSDHPFFMVDPRTARVLYETGLMVRDVEVTLPLTRSVALLATWQHEGTRWTLASHHNVMTMNTRSVSAAERLIAAPTSEAALGEFLTEQEDVAAREYRQAMDRSYPDFELRTNS